MPGSRRMADSGTALDRCVIHASGRNAAPAARSGVPGEGNSLYFRDPDGSLMEFIPHDA